MIQHDNTTKTTVSLGTFFLSFAELIRDLPDQQLADGKKEAIKYMNSLREAEPYKPLEVLFRELSTESLEGVKNAHFFNFATKTKQRVLDHMKKKLGTDDNLREFYSNNAKLVRGLLRFLKKRESFLVLKENQFNSHPSYPFIEKLFKLSSLLKEKRFRDNTNVDLLLNELKKKKRKNEVFSCDISSLWKLATEFTKSDSPLITKVEQLFFLDHQNKQKIYFDLLKALFSQIEKKEPEVLLYLALEDFEDTSIDAEFCVNKAFSFFFENFQFEESSKTLSLLNSSFEERFSVALEILEKNTKINWVDLKHTDLARGTRGLLFTQESLGIFESLQSSLRSSCTNMDTVFDRYLDYKKDFLARLEYQNKILPHLHVKDVRQSFVKPFLKEILDKREISGSRSSRTFWNLGTLPKTGGGLYTANELKERDLPVEWEQVAAFQEGVDTPSMLYDYMSTYLSPCSVDYIVESHCQGLLVYDFGPIIKLLEILALFN